MGFEELDAMINGDILREMPTIEELFDALEDLETRYPNDRVSALWRNAKAADIHYQTLTRSSRG